MQRAALLFTLVLCAMLSNRVAGAFDCTGVTKPSSVVICSDPDLMRLADERQEAIYEARGRIGEEAWPALWENQQTWVRSYAPACGIRQNRPPPMPVPATIRGCFKRAAEARIAFIRGYGLPAPGTLPAIPKRVGPGFDCSKAVRPLALIICADPDLAEVDFRFNQAYWALFQQLNGPARHGLLQEDAAFIDAVQEQCRVPRSGGLAAQEWQTKLCIRGSYEGQRIRWLFRLSDPAYEEATRPAERHLALQGSLQSFGFLAGASVTDGVYGEQTRNAIIAWQTARGRAPTGLLGDDDARALERDNTGTAGPGPAPPTTLPPQRDEVQLTAAGNVFRVPVHVNGAITLSFVLDSGASDVLIPADVVGTLIRAGTLSDEDLIGSATYGLADGSKVRGDQFRLREVRLGNHVVRNVVASMGPVNGDLLLGQSFLSRFGTWAIDNVRHVLILGMSDAG
jgi:uncharacterized protein/predicted aspartyl protease